MTISKMYGTAVIEFHTVNIFPVPQFFQYPALYRRFHEYLSFLVVFNGSSLLSCSVSIYHVFFRMQKNI